MILGNNDFGSPYKNRDSGLITSNDHENNRNCKQIMNTFL
jgi:hypothetical protein